VEAHVLDTVGPCVVRRSDGVWSYQLAVAVDDLRMGMTHILRGADLLDSTARQLAMMDAVVASEGAEGPARRPRYAHVPVVYGPDGLKLSKRHGAPDLTSLREAGADPARVVAFLGRSMGMLTDQVTHAVPRDLLKSFRLDAAGRAPDRLDPQLMEEFGDVLSLRAPP
jgi:glutamyl-tRNA synthetase